MFNIQYPANAPVAREIRSIELLRGLASLMVCVFHLSNGNTAFLPDSSPIKRIGEFGWVGVEIFFVISGFVIPYAMYTKRYQMSSFWTFLKKRVIRIEPPYLVSIVLVLILGFVSTLSPYYKGAPFVVDWANVFSHLGYLNIFTGEAWLNPVYWSLAIEFQYYLLIALVFGLIISPNVAVRVAFFTVFAALSFLPVGPNKFIFTYTPYFIAGILLFQYFCQVIGSREFLVMVILNSLLLLYSQGIGLTMVVLATLAAIQYVKQVPRLLRNLGLISYSLYLIHVPIGGRIINISATLITNPLVRECMVFVAIVISLLFSIGFYRFVERRFKQLSASISYYQTGKQLEVVSPVKESL
ncbi:acyltransferase family protein [Paraflavitalea pollutisoli]|uniref:acyltransferase family protein n=1 Tax=Paraflavitalea pollutisoli TaxID=3034143 RepID=UPI0023EA8454|nr:acyltransferase [Paraflavitalea sp. H1-2-19X]